MLLLSHPQRPEQGKRDFASPCVSKKQPQALR